MHDDLQFTMASWYADLELSLSLCPAFTMHDRKAQSH